MSTAAALWKELHAKYTSEAWVDYSRQPLPHILDTEITRLVEAYREADERGREELRRAARTTQRIPLLAYAERMATLGLRERLSRRLEDALVAIAIDDFGFDARDAIPLLALQYHTAKRIGTDPHGLFELASRYASNSVGEVLRSFPEREERDKSLAVMGYRESQNEAAPLAYERIPQ